MSTLLNITQLTADLPNQEKSRMYNHLKRRNYSHSLSFVLTQRPLQYNERRPAPNLVMRMFISQIANEMKGNRRNSHWTGFHRVENGVMNHYVMFYTSGSLDAAMTIINGRWPMSQYGDKVLGIRMVTDGFVEDLKQALLN